MSDCGETSSPVGQWVKVGDEWTKRTETTQEMEQRFEQMKLLEQQVRNPVLLLPEDAPVAIPVAFAAAAVPEDEQIDEDDEDDEDDGVRDFYPRCDPFEPPTKRSRLDVMGDGDLIPSRDPAALVHREGLVVVNVTHVRNPSHFYARIRGNSDENAIDELEQLLHSTLSSSSPNLFCMTQNSILIPGLFVAHKAPSSSPGGGGARWRRAMLLEVLSRAADYKVWHIDHGSVAYTALSDMRFLPKRFGGLPCQSIRCHMALIKPSSGRRDWSRQDSDTFENLVKDADLAGVVVDHDSDKGLGLILATYDKEKYPVLNKCVNRELVEMDCAVDEDEAVGSNMASKLSVAYAQEVKRIQRFKGWSKAWDEHISRH